MYIILAIIAFGILIATHELGHFIAAKACGVKVREFAIGMGPAILKKQRGETLYALRCLPIGGYCAMEGEDEESEDPRAFTRQPAWKRAIILVAGATMNFIFGLILIIIIYSGYDYFASNTVVQTVENFKYGGESGIMAGDTVYSIDGARVYYAKDFSTYMSRSDGMVDMVVIRDGEKVKLKDYQLRTEYYEENGEKVYRYGISFGTVRASVWEKIKFSVYSAWDFVRMVWMGLSDLVTGAVGIKDMSGVVGIVSTINEVGTSSATTTDALLNITYLVAFIAVNLAVMNLLPIPALDGGRIFFLIITSIVETVTRRKINPKYEGYVHAAGLVLLLGLMFFVMINDIVKIIP